VPDLRPPTPVALSVIVCTHNRPKDLERCLDALASLEQRAQVIVVDSGSDPPCRDLVQRYHGQLTDLEYVYEPEPGLSRARNRGLGHASGRVVAFVDDDAAPRPDWGTRILVPFDRDPSIGCVGGACRASFVEPTRRPRWLSDRLLQFAGITRFGNEARRARSSAEWPFGANIAFRADALGRGPFPERLGRHGTTLLSGEEYALVETVRAAGWAVWLEPSAIVNHTVHPERCTSSYYWRRLWWAGVSRARSREAGPIVGLRLVIAAPIRFCIYVLTMDRVYLYRVAETAGFLAERLRSGGTP
jgi:glycosyltransferase involved in cell wall biosynthesis